MAVSEIINWVKQWHGDTSNIFLNFQFVFALSLCRKLPDAMLEITVYPQLTGTARYATMRVMSTTLRTFQLIPQHLEGAGEPPGMKILLKVLSPVLYFWLQRHGDTILGNCCLK